MVQEMRKTPFPTHAQELVQLRTGRNLRDLLVELYVRDGRTQLEIAKALGVSRMTVAMWLREAGIDRTDRKADVA